MTPDRETLRIIGSWMEEGRTRLPDHVLDAVLDQVPSTPQRRPVGSARRFPVMPSFATLAVAAVAIAAVGVVGLTLVRQSSVGPAASPSPRPSVSPGASPSPVTPTPSPRIDADQIVAGGALYAFAQNGSGSVLTVWDSCKNEADKACGHAWRLGSGSDTHIGMVARGDAHVRAVAAGDGFILSPGRGFEGLRIAPDGSTHPLSQACDGASWSTPTEAGRLTLVSEDTFIDTVAGTICSGRLGGRPFTSGGFTSEGTLWVLVENELDTGPLTIGRYDGVGWRYHDFAARSAAATSLLAAAGPNVVVLLASPDPSPQTIVGRAVTTDGGANWTVEVDPDRLARDVPFIGSRWPESTIGFSSYTSMAFAGSSVLYVADGSGALWRSTDLTTFRRVAVPGNGLGSLASAGDSVLAQRFDFGPPCTLNPCRLNDLVRISADGTVEPITPR